MRPTIEETEALRTHIEHLKHAVATTTCRETLATLRQMLSDAEKSLQDRELRPNASNPKML